jgi:hypothetical protein
MCWLILLLSLKLFTPAQGCSISKCTHEGVQAIGTYENAATRAQPKPSHAKGGSHYATSKAAEEWGLQQGIQLQVAPPAMGPEFFFFWGGGGAHRVRPALGPRWLKPTCTLLIPLRLRTLLIPLRCHRVPVSCR